MQGGLATILAGTATVPATVSMAWRTAAAAPGGGNEGFASDVLNLSGMPAIDDGTGGWKHARRARVRARGDAATL